MRHNLRVLLLPVAAAFLCGSLFANNNDKPTFKLVVTGNLQGLRDGTEAFFDSEGIFRQGSKGAKSLVIENALRKVYRFRNTLFIGEGIEPKEILAAAKLPSSMVAKSKILIGAAVIGLEMDGPRLSSMDLADDVFRRELAAVFDQASYEVREVDGKRIIAVAAAVNDSGQIDWPKNGDEVAAVPAVLARLPTTKSTFLLIARQISSTARVLGLVDQILANHGGVSSGYLDLGNALTSNWDESIESARRMKKLLLARKPIITAAERQDLVAQWRDNSIFSDMPVIFPATGKGVGPSCRVVNIQKSRAQFCSVGSPSLGSEAFLPAGAKIMNAADSITQASLMAQESGTKVVFGIAQTANAVSAASANPLFDAVFSLASDPRVTLPAVDDMDFRPNHRNGLRSAAPLVRVSSGDVSEVLFWFDGEGKLERLRIVRHPVVDHGPMAADVQTKILRHDFTRPGLPARSEVSKSEAWTDKELGTILGGLLLESEKGEVALVDQSAPLTPVKSALSMSLAENLVSRPGRAVTFEMMGRQLGRLLRLIKANEFDVPIWMTGATMDGPTIRGRKLYDTESYRVVMTERVAQSVYTFLQQEKTLGTTPFLAGIVTEHLKNKEPHKTLEEIRKITPSDRVRLGSKSEHIASAATVNEIVDQAFEHGISNDRAFSLLRDAPGRVDPTLVFDVADLDLGFSANLINSMLEGWQKRFLNPNDPDKFGITESRLRDPSYIHALVNAKLVLAYGDENIDTELEGKVRYFHLKSTAKERPAEDKVKITGVIRLPVERMREIKGPMVYSPAIRLTYETQIWPNPIFTTDIPVEQWPKRGNELRLFFGVSSKLKAKDELFRVGALMGYNFNRVTDFNQAAAFGGEVAGQYRWNYGILTLRLESELRAMMPITAPDPDRLGIVWNTDGKIEVLAFGNFSVSAIAAIGVASMMVAPGDLGTTTLLGIALSYGDRFKWIF